MSNWISEAWPAVAGVAGGPSVFVVLYKWVVRQLRDTINLVMSQRDAERKRANAADKRADELQDAIDSLQEKYDIEQTKRRAYQDQVEFVLPRITTERDELLVKNTHLKGLLP